jgi:hypothetical protein
MNDQEYRNEVGRFKSGEDRVPYLTIIEWQREDGYYTNEPDAYLSGVEDWEGGRKAARISGPRKEARKAAYLAGREGARKRGVSFGQAGLLRYDQY